MRVRAVTVAGKPKGVVWFEGKRWLWHVHPRGVERFRHKEDVAPFIARVCLVPVEAVSIDHFRQTGEAR